ncbi:MAG: GNAT family N-acetyltransferase [Actinomycetota bacterium]|nr:GNAT family N-acetyltransferase [Actinomycetota bacterium]
MPHAVVTDSGAPILPEGFAGRPAEPADAPAVAALINEASVAAIGVPCIGAKEVAGWFERPTFDRARDSVVVVDQQDLVAAYVDFYTYEVNHDVFFDGYVHPAQRGKGIGDALIRYAIDEFHRRAATVEGLTDLATWCHAAEDGATALFERHGFEEVRRHYKMSVELGDAVLPVMPEGIEIRTYVAGTDDAAMHASYEGGFADHWKHAARATETFIWDVTQREGAEPGLAFLACRGDEIVGGSICRPDPEDPSGGYVDDLWVVPEWRRRGLALALLRHSFEAFRARGSSRVGLGVDAHSTTGAMQLYERAGMKVVREAISFHKRVAP